MNGVWCVPPHPLCKINGSLSGFVAELFISRIEKWFVVITKPFKMTFLARALFNKILKTH